MKDVVDKLDEWAASGNEYEALFGVAPWVFGSHPSDHQSNQSVVAIQVPAGVLGARSSPTGQRSPATMPASLRQGLCCDRCRNGSHRPT